MTNGERKRRGRVDEEEREEQIGREEEGQGGEEDCRGGAGGVKGWSSRRMAEGDGGRKIKG